jgi:protein TonB
MSNKKFAVSLFCWLCSPVSPLQAETPASFDPSKCKVEYPKASLMNEEQGVTSMSFLVNADGSVADSKLEKSSGFKGLDKAATERPGGLQVQAGHQGRRTGPDLDQGRLRLEAGLIVRRVPAGLARRPR